MKEVTSTFDDFEKRFGIYAGLGAFLLHSLGCAMMGAGLETYLVRGLLVFLVFTLVGLWYGKYFFAFLDLDKKDESGKEAEAGDTQVTRHDAAELPDFEAPVPSAVVPAEDSTAAKEFVLPNFEGGVEKAPEGI